MGSTHQCLWSRRVHKIKMDQIINAQFLQLKHYRSQIGPQNFWIGVVLHFVLVCLLCIKSETFSRLGTTSTTSSLLLCRGEYFPNHEKPVCSAQKYHSAVNKC